MDRLATGRLTDSLASVSWTLPVRRLAARFSLQLFAFPRDLLPKTFAACSVIGRAVLVTGFLA